MTAVRAVVRPAAAWAAAVAVSGCLGCALVAQEPVRHATDSVPPPVAETTARRIVLDRIHGSTVRNERLERREGRLVYVYDVAARGEAGDVVVRVDAGDGAVVSVLATRGRGDSAAIADIRKEGALKDTAAMPPNSLSDSTAIRVRDSTSSGRQPASRPRPAGSPP